MIYFFLNENPKKSRSLCEKTSKIQQKKKTIPLSVKALLADLMYVTMYAALMCEHITNLIFL